jgi:hypothetical protein
LLIIKLEIINLIKKKWKKKIMIEK